MGFYKHIDISAAVPESAALQQPYGYPSLSSRPAVITEEELFSPGVLKAPGPKSWGLQPSCPRSRRIRLSAAVPRGEGLSQHGGVQVSTVGSWTRSRRTQPTFPFAFPVVMRSFTQDPV